MVMGATIDIALRIFEAELREDHDTNDTVTATHYETLTREESLAEWKNTTITQRQPQVVPLIVGFSRLNDPKPVCLTSETGSLPRHLTDDCSNLLPRAIHIHITAYFHHLRFDAFPCLVPSLVPATMELIAWLPLDLHLCCLRLPFEINYKVP